MAKKVTQTQAVDFFAVAKPVAPKAALSNSGKDRVQVEGMDEYAALDVVEKTVKALKEGARVSLQHQSMQVFFDEAERTQKRPDSFKGIDTNSEASVELRRKASNQPINDEVVEILTEIAVPFDTVEDKPETFIVNPERLEWLQENSQSLSKLLAKIGAPIDLFQKQEAVAKRVVTDETLAAICKKDRDTIERVLPLVTNFAIKPTTNEDPTEALVRVLVTTLGEGEEDYDAKVVLSAIKKAAKKITEKA